MSLGGGGLSGTCGKMATDATKIQISAPPGVKSCKIQYMSGQYLKTAVGDLSAGLYGISLFIEC